MRPVIVLSGGGTGGHVFPAIALAQQIRHRSHEVEVRFLSTESPVTRFIEAAGFALERVESRPLLGRGPLEGLRALAAIARGILQARRILRRTRASLVIGVGGYASVPAVVAALTLRLPTALLEPDAAPGRANRLLGRFTRRVFVQFESASAHFPRGRALVTGFPVRPIPPRAAGKAYEGLRLLVMGGSQGARTLNRAICVGLAELAELGVEITHQTGSADCAEVRAAYRSAGLAARVDPFFDDLPAHLAETDLVVARAGASSVAEFCCAGLAQILVPYPHAAAHQLQNALELERAGAALVIRDAEANERLCAAVADLVRDPERRARMEKAALACARPGAADSIWSSCRELLEGRA